MLCSYRECDNEFAPKQNVRYCSPLCRGREKERRTRENPQSAAKRAASRKSTDRARHERDRDKRNQLCRDRYWRDPVRARAEALANYHSDPQQVIDRNRAWRVANREHVRAYQRAYRLLNPQASTAKQRARSARIAAAPSAPISLDAIRSRLAYFGSRCWMCGGAFECWDHVKPLAKGGSHMLSNLRPACTDCNRRKLARWYGTSALDRFIASK